MAKKIDKKDYEIKLFKFFGNKFKLIEYTEYKNDCKILHLKCNKEFIIKPNQIFKTDSYLNDVCPKCRNNFKHLDKEVVNNNLQNVTNNRIIIIDDNYENVNAKTKCKCLVCNNEFETIISSLINNVKTNKTKSFGCPYCSKKRKYTTEDIKKRLEEVTNGEYILKSEYINNSTKINLYHTKCNKIYKVTSDKFFNRGDRCPCCISHVNSKNVKIIENFLIKNKILYNREKTFDGCISKRKLKFDFYLKDLNLLIEFDGEQHFKTKYYEENFIDTKNRDNIKNQFSINNSISLIRIPFDLKEDEIKEVLDNLLLKENYDNLINIIKNKKVFYNDAKNDIIYNMNSYYKKRYKLC